MKRPLPPTVEEEAVWDALVRSQHLMFKTMKGLTFSYAIIGNEMFVDRKEKSITRATVNLAYRRAMELRRDGVPIDGPKKLGTFGASYLFPIFISLGFISPPKKKGEQTVMPLGEAECGGARGNAACAAVSGSDGRVKGE